VPASREPPRPPTGPDGRRSTRGLPPGVSRGIPLVPTGGSADEAVAPVPHVRSFQRGGMFPCGGGGTRRARGCVHLLPGPLPASSHAESQPARRHGPAGDLVGFGPDTPDPTRPTSESGTAGRSPQSRGALRLVCRLAPASEEIRSRTALDIGRDAGARSGWIGWSKAPTRSPNSPVPPRTLRQVTKQASERRRLGRNFSGHGREEFVPGSSRFSRFGIGPGGPGSSAQKGPGIPVRRR
jgi:hypothetical protein